MRSLSLTDSETELHERIDENDSHHVVHELGDSEGRSASKKPNRASVSRAIVILVTLAASGILTVESIFNFQFVRQSQAIHLNVFFYWVQSCFITVFFNLWARKKVKRYCLMFYFCIKS